MRRQKTPSVGSAGSNGAGNFAAGVPTIVKAAGQDEVDVEYGEPMHLTLARGPNGVGYGVFHAYSIFRNFGLGVICP